MSFPHSNGGATEYKNREQYIHKGAQQTEVHWEDGKRSLVHAWWILLTRIYEIDFIVNMHETTQP